ncbi:probable L-type lectin-domain containing receptor kinase S.5 [Cryptomeria japonica]|uniref:probable L-type lectin-domain containing receptor kinase S.5 n=1 Tax=Cryptomeria japonica TaxID=3369 RepID=UPI0027D9F91A|nr:probable L-type lectin-domain containing receptor kinase S.5 [Cryptomeria japonica]
MGFHRVSLALASIFLVQTVSGNFNYQSFSEKNVSLFMFDHSVIDLGSLQVTAETRNRRSPNSPKNRSGRVIFNQKYRLWKEPDSPASFNSTFVFNIAPDMGTGEGMAFIISSNKDIGSGPVGSYGRWLGLFNSTINGLKSNKVVAVEFDTIKSEGTNDPDDNHVAIDVNSINSTKIASLDVGHINLTNEDQNITAWIQYSGTQRLLKVYIAKTPDPMPSQPILQHPLNLSKILDPFVYFGFTASTGEGTELNCVHSWSLSIQDLESSKPNTGLKIGLLVSGMALAVLLATVIVIVYIKHRKYQAEEAIISDTLRKLPGQPHEFKYKTLQKATQSFSTRTQIGCGGCGAVYKAHIRKSKTAVAVKRIFKDSTQGKDEFISEIGIINQLRHRNLVPFLGWCHDKGNLLMVYEYMPSGSLEKYIAEGLLDWEQRYKIISGLASALVYLHEECEHQVIHRDLKPSNIMLDSEYNARLGDFGLARIIQPNRSSFTASRVAGTIGYIAPECFHTGKATVESDVFGFGAIVLEVVCGRPPWAVGDGLDLVGWVWKLYRENKLFEAAECRLPLPPPADTPATVNQDDITCLFMVGLACSHPNPQERPTMRQVKQILCRERPLPSVPTYRPPFVWLHSDYEDSSLTGSSFGTSRESVSNLFVRA